MKQTTGNEDFRSDERAETFGQGVTKGIRGLGQELGRGIGGIFTKPLEGGKDRGVKGFVGGIGKGLVGAVSSPVTGILRAGESMSQGISHSANNFSNIGKSQLDILDPKIVKIRPNRRIDHKGQIQDFNYEHAIINVYLSKIHKGYLIGQQIRFYHLFKDFMSRSKLFLLTTEYVILVDSLNFKELMNTKLVKASVRFCFKITQIRHYDMSVSHLADETPVYYL